MCREQNDLLGAEQNDLPGAGGLGKVGSPASDQGFRGFSFPNCSQDFCVILFALPEMSYYILVWSPLLGVLVVSLLYPMALPRLSEGEK